MSADGQIVLFIVTPAADPGAADRVMKAIADSSNDRGYEPYSTCSRRGIPRLEI